MWWKLIIIILSIFGSVWFGRLAYIAARETARETGLSYIKELFINGSISIVCILIAILLSRYVALI